MSSEKVIFNDKRRRKVSMNGKLGWLIKTNASIRYSCTQQDRTGKRQANSDGWTILFLLNMESSDRVKVMLYRVVFANTYVRDHSVGRALAFQRRT
jgi:hypothetical protein